MMTRDQMLQRLLFLRLKLKHRFTIVEFINIDNINKEIEWLNNYVESYFQEESL